jgi:hypothetical protein
MCKVYLHNLTRHQIAVIVNFAPLCCPLKQAFAFGCFELSTVRRIPK